MIAKLDQLGATGFPRRPDLRTDPILFRCTSATFKYQFLFFTSELEGTLEGLSLDDGLDEERGVEVGKAVTFSVDAAGAGEGTLELVVSTPSTTVKAEVCDILYVYTSVYTYVLLHP